MLLALLDISVAASPIIHVIIVPAFNFDLGMLPMHMIFELVRSPEALKALSRTSLGKTVVGSGTAFVGLEMARKVAFSDECLVAIFNAAYVSCGVCGSGCRGWWFAIRPVFKDQSLLVI